MSITMMNDTIVVFDAAPWLITDVQQFFSLSGGPARLTVTRPQSTEAGAVPVPCMRQKASIVRESCGTFVLERKLHGAAPGNSDRYLIRNSAARVITSSQSFASELWTVITNLPYSPVIRVRGESGAGKSHVARLLHSMRRDAQSPPRSVHGMCMSNLQLAGDAFGAENQSSNDRLSAARLLEMAFGKNMSHLIVDEPQMLPRWMLRAMFDAANENTKINVTFCVQSANKSLGTDTTDTVFNNMTFCCPEVFVPALRARPADIVPLFLDLCLEMQESMRRGTVFIDGNWLEEIKHHHWPGNIRELKELARRFVLFAPESGFRRHEFTTFGSSDVLGGSSNTIPKERSECR